MARVGRGFPRRVVRTGEPAQFSDRTGFLALPAVSIGPQPPSILAKPPVVTNLTTWQVAISQRRAQPRRGVHSSIGGPVVVFVPPAYQPPVRVTTAPTRRRGRTRSSLPTVLGQVGFVAAPVRVEIVRTRPRRTASRVVPPAVAAAAGAFSGPLVRLVSSRPRRTTSRLTPPTATATFAGPQTHLVRTRPRGTVSRLVPPTVTAAQAGLAPPVQTTLVAVRARAERQRRGGQGTLGGPVSVFVPPPTGATPLVRTVRARPRYPLSRLGAPVTVTAAPAAASFAAGKPTLARTRPRRTLSRLAPPAAAAAATTFLGPATTLARVRPRRASAKLGPPAATAAVGPFPGPSITLARLRRRPPLSRLGQPAAAPAAIASFSGSAVVLARIRWRRPYSRLATPAVVAPPQQVAAFYGPQTTLVAVRTRAEKQRRGVGSSLGGPVVVGVPASAAVTKILVGLTRSPRRQTRSALQNYLVSVTTPNATFAGPQTHLVRTRPRGTVSNLRPPTVVAPPTAFVAAPIRVQLAARRTAPYQALALLQSPSEVGPAAIFAAGKPTLARTRPRQTTRTRRPLATVAAVQQTRSQQVLARTRPRRTVSILRPPTVVLPPPPQREQTVRTELAGRTRADASRRAPRSRLAPPILTPAGPPAVSKIEVVLAPAAARVLVGYRRTRGTLEPPVVVNPPVPPEPPAPTSAGGGRHDRIGGPDHSVPLLGKPRLPDEDEAALVEILRLLGLL